jgi:predicted permease
VTTILKDLHYGLRMTLKRPGTSLLAVAALGLGIGLTTTMFSIVQGAMLRGLPFEDSDRIMAVGRRTATLPATSNSQPLPPHDFVDYAAAQTSFESLAGFNQLGVNVSGGLAPERYRAARITTNTLRVLRVATVLGRDFNEADGRPGAPPVALISYRVWASQFEKDPGVLSEPVRVNGVPTTIVGVLPERFGFPTAQDLWLPAQITRPVKRGEGQSLQAFGRLKPGVSRTEAETEIRALAARLALQYPENEGTTAQVQPYIERFIGREPRVTLTAMLGAVFGVLLIACANVTSLQLARAAERTREFAVRSALGAGRGRVVTQLLLEGLLLSAAGALVGLTLGALGCDLFNASIQDTSPPFWIDIRIDRTVVAFVVALAIVATVASSLVPALRATRLNLSATLADEGRGNTGLHMGRFSRWLVTGEVLLSCALLVVSGLMIKSVVSLGRIEYPFETERAFMANFTLDETQYATDSDVARALARLEERWSAVPGVRRAALSTGLPGRSGDSLMLLEGRTYASDHDRPTVLRMAVSPAFFDTLGVPIRRGRGFTAADTASAPRVAVVDEAYAAKFFPGGDPLGASMRLSGDPAAPSWTIVGLVPTLVADRDQGELVEGVYVPLAQAPSRFATVIAAASGPPLSLTSAMRMAAREVDPDLPIAGSNTVTSELGRRNWHVRVFGSLFMSFGIAALVMACAGLYGLMAFSVRRRTQEIGVRLALGATRAGIIRMVVWEGLWRVGLGVALGLAPAYFLGGLMQALLFRVTQGDPLVFGATVLALLASGLAASMVPAVRAASVSPLLALKDA